MTADRPWRWIAVLPLVAACDWLTCPTIGQGCDQEFREYPEVAGVYGGAVTATGAALSEPVTGPMEMTVYQGDNAWLPNNDVTVRATTSLSGVPLLPGLIGVIDEAGVFTWTEGGKDYDPACGVTETVTAALSFSGSTVTYGAQLSTADCGGFRFDATLQRRQ